MKFSLPDGMYCAAYILMIDAIWHNDKGIIKDFIISLIPIVAISSEIFQCFGLFKGTFDVYDLICYAVPPLIYMQLRTRSNTISISSPMKRFFITTCVLTMFVLGFSSSQEENANIKLDSEQFVGKSERVKGITSIEEMRKVINNTVWTHSKEDYLWHKLYFKDNQVEQYTAILSNSKRWEYLGSSPFTLKKGKFSDGMDYISAEFKLTKGNVSAEFVFSNCHLYIPGIDFGGFNNVDIVW